MVASRSSCEAKRVHMQRERRVCKYWMEPVVLESPVTFLRNPRSRSPGNIGHLGPEYAITCSRQFEALHLD